MPRTAYARKVTVITLTSRLIMSVNGRLKLLADRIANAMSSRDAARMTTIRALNADYDHLVGIRRYLWTRAGRKWQDKPGVKP